MKLTTELTFREFPFDSDDYHTMKLLRDKVLRLPLGLVLSEENLRGEESQRHFGLFDANNEPVAGVIVVKRDGEWFQVRQMAVEPSLQGKGHGARLIKEVENILRTDGIRQVFLKARLGVKGFYLRSNYAETGDIFEEVGIPHIRMEKVLS